MKSAPTIDVPIEAPLEIKKKIAKRLQKKGVLKKIQRKIKLGMMVAIEEIQEDPKADGNLERKPFKDVSRYEQKALQAVFNFLSDHNMTYTLSAILEESSARRNLSDTTNILNYIDISPQSPAQRDFSDDDDVLPNDNSHSESQLDRLIDSELDSDSHEPPRKNRK